MSAVLFSLPNSMELFLYPKLICIRNQYMFTGFHPVRPYVKLGRVVKKPSLKCHFRLVSQLDDCAVNVSAAIHSSTSNKYSCTRIICLLQRRRIDASVSFNISPEAILS